MRRGSCGVKALNKALREIVNPATAGTPALGGFRIGDKVMVIKNHYGLEVFNGDTGIVISIEKGKLTVDFGDQEVDFAVEHLELLVLAYASTIHKCVALNTLIETDRGLLRINLANSGRVAAIDGVKAFTRTSMLPRQKMLRITTEDGYRIIATPDHGLDTWDGEEYQRIEARELKIDDWLQIGLNPRLEPAEIPKLPAPISGDVREKVFSVPEKLTEDLAEFFGLMVADGTSFERGFRLAKRHKEVTDRFAELCFNLFGYKAQRYFQNGAYFAEVCSVYLRRWLKNIGGMEPNKKAVPDCILAGNSNHHRAFLRGLFEDASVNIRTSDPGMVDHIDFCTCMEGLAADVQVMLARLGLVSNHVRGVGYNRKHRHSKLYIYGEYARKFGSEIGFISYEKQKRCELKAGCQTRYCIPVTVDEFKEIRRLNESVFTNSDLSNVRTRGHISRNQYKKLKIVPSHLKERFENHHSRIVSIEKFIGESTCLNVPEGHRFLQNAISGWNSQGSEFKLVIMGLCSQHYIMLQRNLLYTGMTRAKERLMLVSDTRSVAMAVKNNKIEERLSRLKERVQEQKEREA
jgi:intein/homing endonuclease